MHAVITRVGYIMYFVSVQIFRWNTIRIGIAGLLILMEMPAFKAVFFNIHEDKAFASFFHAMNFEYGLCHRYYLPVDRSLITGKKRSRRKGRFFAVQKTHG
jgi:hypothetical protein